MATKSWRNRIVIRLPASSRLLGSDEAAARLKRGETGRQVLEEMRGQLQEFLKIRAKYLLYE
jgi:hypothetical protein